MAVNLAPGPFGAGGQFFDTNGKPLNAGFINTYAAGTTTPLATYTTSLGNVPNGTTITLGVDGRPPQEIWLTAGSAYRFDLLDSSNNLIKTYDNLTGINDISGIGEWVLISLIPVFISSTSFSLTGNQTTLLPNGMRLKTANTGGTMYGKVVSSSYAAIPNTTTFVIANDPGAALDVGLSSVSYSILNPANPSVDSDYVLRKATLITSAGVTNIWAIAGDLVHITPGTVTSVTSFGTALYAGNERTVIADGVLTVSNSSAIQIIGSANITTAAGDRFKVRADTITQAVILNYSRALQDIVSSGVIASGKNISARTNSATPNTKLDIAADEFVLEDTSGNIKKVSSVNLTIDFGVTGANGLDTLTQAPNTWNYGWVIAKTDGSVAGLGSTSTSAPTMPSGYTFKGLATAARSDGSTHFLKYRQLGNTVHYEASNSILNSGTVSTSETTVSLSSFTPPTAEETILSIYGFALASVVGAIDSTALLRVISGSTRNIGQIKTSGASQGSTWAYEASVPNVSQQVFVLFTNSTNFGASQYNVDALGFKLPLGGE